MDEKNKRRVGDSINGFRRYVNFQSILAFVILVGLTASFVSSIKIIPDLAKTVESNYQRIMLVERDIEYIREGIKDIRAMLKEK